MGKNKTRGDEGSSMGLYIIIFVMIVGWLIYSSGGNESKPTPAAQQKTEAHTPMASQTPATPPLPPGPRTWPPSSNAKVEMARNPTASNYLIIFDASGSMSDRECSGAMSKIDVAKKAVKSFVGSLDESANVGLVAFGATPTGQFFEQDFVNTNKDLIGQALDRVESGGRTPLQGAMARGYRMLETQARRQGGYGQYHMVIITDGISTDGDPGDTAIGIVSGSAIQIHAIGFCLEGAHSLDRRGYTRYSTANNPAALAAGLAGVLAETEQFDAGAFVSQ